jgi:NAD(P)-dependent dehydrogenase (short-subunit alcohol dehydrogenase family)
MRRLLNITSTQLVLKRLVPQLLGSARPQLILTGSTSALRLSGRPEMAFGASELALNGMADAWREGFRDQLLAVTILQVGYLNSDDSLANPLDDAAVQAEGQLIPAHDLVTLATHPCACRRFF